MEKTTRIVILGGGYAGVHATKQLAKRFRRDRNVEISLIDKNPYHTLMTELHEVAGSRTDAEAVQVNFGRIFNGSKVKVLVDEVDGIDFEQKILKSNNAEYHYDYLILGTGGQPEFFGIPGVQEYSYTLWSLEDAIRIREHVELCFRNAAKEPSQEKKKALLTFAIAGAGFTGIELAGEIIERADVLCGKYHIDRDEVRILIIEAKDSILPMLSKKSQNAAMAYLKKLGAEVLINTAIVKADQERVYFEDQTSLRADTFIWTGGIQASEFTARINLTKGKVSNDNCSVASPEGVHGMAGCHFDEDERHIVGARGRVLVDSFLQSVDYKDVYLCGDMIWLVHDEKVVPQIVENALQSAEYAAANIVASMRGKERKQFVPNFHGFVVSIGSKYAVAHVMGISIRGFFGMALKHVINLHYLWGLAGVNACWTYLQDEFLNVRNRRSMLGGHAAVKVQAFWLLPARLWLGLVWLIEALNKVGDGWLRFDEGSKSKDLFSSGDAVSVASDVLVAPFSLLDWDINSPILAQDSPLVLFFKSVFMDGMMAAIPFQVFQSMVVVSELAIGLALVAGFLTFPAAALSIGMCSIFILTGMFSWSQVWFMVVAVALMGGAGQAVGLDYWFMPWLKKNWNASSLAHRTHFYTDEPSKKKSTKRVKKSS